MTDNVNTGPSASSRKVLIIHDDGNVFNNPTVKSIIDLLLDNGVTIDLRYPNSDAPTPRYRDIKLLPFGRFIKKLKSFAYNRLCSWTCVYSAVWIEKTFTYSHYDLIIGIDRQGLLEAKALSTLTDTPFVYFSFEITFEDETSRRFKSLEKNAAKTVSGWMVQDKTRAEVLQHENGLDESTRFLLPLASSGPGEKSPHRLRDSLGIPLEKNVAIIIGSLSSWTMTSELLRSVADWPEDWVLIIHDRYGLTSRSLADELAPVSHLINKKIYISDAASDLVDDMAAIFQGVSIGLAFYKPVYTGLMADRLTGKNLKILGLAAGKISTYLRYGVPVIMNDVGLYAKEARQYQFGCVAETPGKIKNCLEIMNIERCKINARAYFDQQLDFNLYKDKVYSDLLYMLESPTNTLTS